MCPQVADRLVPLSTRSGGRSRPRVSQGTVCRQRASFFFAPSRTQRRSQSAPPHPAHGQRPAAAHPIRSALGPTSSGGSSAQSWSRSCSMSQRACEQKLGWDLPWLPKACRDPHVNRAAYWKTTLSPVNLVRDVRADTGPRGHSLPLGPLPPSSQGGCP